MKKHRLKSFGIAVLSTLIMSASSYADEAAKKAFGSQNVPSAGPARSIGFYSKGCISGAVALPIDGPTWQVMRLSRNRNWGHPKLIEVLQRISVDSARDGWPGLLVGDLSQPRGGPMLNGHASHQVGLDADIWLRPMPNHRLSRDEREKLQGISMLKGDSLYADPAKWTPGHTALIRNAATNPEVERIFVHPGIKKQLCDTVRGDRSWLGKVRPYWGHYWHFHIRIRCQPGSNECSPQAGFEKGDGCGKALAWWFTDEPWVPKKTPPGQTPPKPREVMVSDMPRACQSLLNAPAGRGY